MNQWVGLIRGIGPSTHKKMKMAQLREACAAAGFDDVRTLIATGNLIFTTTLPEDEIAEVLRGILDGFGLDNPVFLRRPADIESVYARNPWPELEDLRPNHLLVMFMDDAPAAEAIATLAEWPGPERMVVSGREVFVDYAEGVGDSKLTYAVIERRLEQLGTARNWNTVNRVLDATRGD